jgi:hypothetical protein
MGTRLLGGCLGLIAIWSIGCEHPTVSDDQAGSVSMTSAALVSAEGSKPVDLIGDLGAVPAAVAATAKRKAPPLRRATIDEIEDLNGTFRTPGSRDRILRRIAVLPPTERGALAAVLRAAIEQLPPQEQAEAKAKLATSLTR